MITEDYVSFETAKLLKEKGFDEECSCFYNNIDYGTPGLEVDGQLYYKNSALDDEEYSAPTLQTAMKWLREIYHIHITIYPYGEYSCDNYQFDVYKDNNLVVSKDDGYITYEQACEVAIKYCLENLI